MILNKQQREFLKYIEDCHLSLGYGHTISSILQDGYYNSKRLEVINLLKMRFDWLKMEKKSNKPQDDWFNINRYGEPTKYLK